MNYKKIYGKKLTITVANDLKGLYNLETKSGVSTAKSTIKPHCFQFTQLIPSIVDPAGGEYVSTSVLYSWTINFSAEYQTATLVKDNWYFYPIPSAIVKNKYKDDEYICGCGYDECFGCGHDL